ncbi:MAG: hypothetical protein CMH81_01625 [Nitrospiraceae bacterium]|nr:hypothetical protein [Nitrospiraceae bacterium]|tara:strand:+ start:686 stop:3277 length:2592 start_codon:yes stop_codon:yes gene_type:complete
MTSSRLFIFSVFFLSGIAGIIYQILWMREVQILFGNTAQSAAAVLLAFFLGMALGNAWGGRLSARVHNPLVTYAIVEFGIALTAVPVLLLTPLYLHLSPILLSAFATVTWAFDLSKLVLVLGFMLPASILIGATFPLLGTAVIVKRSCLGMDAGRLYGINTLGAVCGVALSGFLLPVLLGNTLTYVLALLTNCAIGATVLLWQRKRAGAGGEQLRKAVLDHREVQNDPILEVSDTPFLPQHVLFAIACGSGLCTIALEVLWTRMFALVFQNSVYSFSAIVLIFLVGLAIGALLIATSQKFLRFGVGLLGVSLGMTAFCVLLTPILFSATTDLSLFASGVGWPWYLFKVIGLVAGIILLPVILAGFTLPLLWKLYEHFQRPVGSTLGTINLWNLLGALSGGIAAAYLLIPMLGLWNAIVAVAILLLVLSQLAVFYASPGWMRRFGVVLVPACVAVLLFANPTQYSSQKLLPGERLLYLDEGKEAAISVVEDSNQVRWLKSNNTYRLGATTAIRGEKRLGHLPLLLHPSPKNVAFIGVATGVSVSAGIDHNLTELVGVEILPGVLNALSYFEDHNRNLLAHDNVTAILDDGRIYLRSTDRRFDVIVADLFIPWHAGNGSLYTREHYEASRQRLSAQGIYCQWLPLYQLSEREVGIIAATFAEVFPHVSVWRSDFSANAPILGLMGSNAPIVIDSTVLQSRLDALQRKISPKDRLLQEVVDVSLMYAGDISSVKPWLARFPVNTEDWPIIEFDAAISESHGRIFAGLPLADFYYQLGNQDGTAIQLKVAGENHPMPMSPKAGNLLFRAVALGDSGDIRGQVSTLQEATRSLPHSSYLKMVNAILRSRVMQRGRGVDRPSPNPTRRP